MDIDHPEHLLDHGQLVRSLAAALVTTGRPAGFPVPRWLRGVAAAVTSVRARSRRLNRA